MLGLAGPVGVTAFQDEPEPRRIWAESKELMVLHQGGASFDNGLRKADCLSKDNTWSWIQLRDRGTGKFLWKKPIMPLENLWISSDSAYVVGLSSHQRHPEHLVVYRRDGTQALALNAETEMPNLEWKLYSTPNVRWYDFRKPSPAIIREGGKVYLTLTTRSWVTREVHSKRARFEIPQPDGP